MTTALISGSAIIATNAMNISTKEKHHWNVVSKTTMSCKKFTTWTVLSMHVESQDFRKGGGGQDDQGEYRIS